MYVWVRKLVEASTVKINFVEVGRELSGAFYACK